MPKDWPSEAQGPPPHTPRPRTHIAGRSVPQEGTFLSIPYLASLDGVQGRRPKLPKEGKRRTRPPSLMGKNQMLTSFGSLAAVAWESVPLTEDADLRPLTHPPAESRASLLLWGCAASWGPHYPPPRPCRPARPPAPPSHGLWLRRAQATPREAARMHGFRRRPLLPPWASRQAGVLGSPWRGSLQSPHWSPLD